MTHGGPDEASTDDTGVPEIFVCPSCRSALRREGSGLTCARCARVGQHTRGVWDFVLEDDYAANFGRQWSEYRYTQVDSRNGTTISRDQFTRVTGWSSEDLAGRSVLDAGCGGGRYSEIAQSLGARLTSLDLSEAAYVAREILSRERVTVVRGNLLKPPFPHGTFDKVFSIGVLQHTPDPLGIAEELVRLVKPGGEVAIWMYDRRWYSPLLPKYIMRLATNRLPERTRPAVAQTLVTAFTPVARLVSHLPAGTLRRVLHKALPIASYWGMLPLTPEQQQEWSLLDTSDWLTPAYDLPQNFEELSEALRRGGAATVERRDVPGLTVRARRAE